VYALRQNSSFGWDTDRGILTASDPVWKAYLEVILPNISFALLAEYKIKSTDNIIMIEVHKEARKF